MSTPTHLLPGDSESERPADEEISADAARVISQISATLAAEPLTATTAPLDGDIIGAVAPGALSETFVLPARRASRHQGTRPRLLRGRHLIEAGVVLLVLGVTLSSFGLLPGDGWPLSLIDGNPATAVAKPAAGAIAPAGGLLIPLPQGPGQPVLRAFARAKGLTVYVPTHRLLAIGYHEAATSGAFRLTPLGRCTTNLNKRKIRTPRTTEGPDYLILTTRYRRQGATTAADIAMPKGATVVAPISGRVIQVAAYTLYKYWSDYRVAISPRRGSRLQVVMIHLTDLQVHKGQMVVAGVTPIGHPRVFSFTSEINDYVGAGVPHVHLEVKEIGPSRRTA